METGQRLKVSSDRLVKPGIEPATPGLQGKWFIHYTTATPNVCKLCACKVYRGSYMNAHVLLNLLNEWGKEIKCEAC